MKRGGDRLEEVLALARQAARRADASHVDAAASAEALPVGFATRVAARWASTPVLGEWELWDRVTRWGLALAVAVCVVAFAMRPSEPDRDLTPFDQMVMGPVGEGRS
jgi:hypothetical protein